MEVEVPQSQNSFIGVDTLDEEEFDEIIKEKKGVDIN